MARLTWLPEVLRDAGLTVHEVSGWRGRGSDLSTIRGITIHETRGSRQSTDAGEINVLLHGSNTAPPPIAQLYLSRTGDWWVVASGRCNHNLVGWSGPNQGHGNNTLVGIEAQHAGGEPWTDRQYRSYVRGVAALVRRLGIPVNRVGGHKEHQPAGYGHASTKTDPSFDMDQFRRDVASVLAGGDDDMSEAASRIVEAWSRGLPKTPAGENVEPVQWRMRDEAWQAQVLAQLRQLAGKDWVDEQQIVDGVLAGLGGRDLDEVVEVLVAAMGPDRAAELGRRLTPTGPAS
ncbi:N-acetylmuramoyl-L-alanine amidase [Micromonospora polyrhachis]|uniref:N-acetylmuramoyl-L-alanine amidase domain-containing protein n=1 Tax=Micromonospora polyrhachis TaxID=1282883 RepID=A0A7W7SQA0_9ACTN|nr:N-acetylmuramoyl-L-alanine amidase [Micromonospora polyrhachis]MBB4958960.1 hypothetical protein [Micromonospora polyrhachis]